MANQTTNRWANERTNQLTDRPAEQLTDQPTNQLTNWVTECLIEWLIYLPKVIIFKFGALMIKELVLEVIIFCSLSILFCCDDTRFNRFILSLRTRVKLTGSVIKNDHVICYLILTE